MKICSKCKEEKPFDAFSKDKHKKDGFRPDCKECVKARYDGASPESIMRRTAIRNQWIENNPDKFKESQKKYRSKNKERTKIRAEEYYSENKESIQKQRSEYYSENPDLLIAHRKKWKSENPEYIRCDARKRRSRKRGAEGFHTKTDIDNLFEAQNGKCASCLAKLKCLGKNIFHVDHIQPLSRGGSNWPSNMQLLCPTCNMRKSAKDPFAWAKENGKLL